jgi:hypothetical protein
VEAISSKMLATSASKKTTQNEQSPKKMPNLVTLSAADVTKQTNSNDLKNCVAKYVNYRFGTKLDRYPLSQTHYHIIGYEENGDHKIDPGGQLKKTRISAN